MVDNLLQPSLRPTGSAAAIYSIQAGFLVAFIGGPLAAVLFAALNSRRLGRLGPHSPWLVLGAVVAIGAMVAQVILLDTARAGDGGLVTTQNARIANRAIALLLFGGYYLLHRSQYRSMQFLGLESPTPWLPAILCVVAGSGLTIVVAAMVAAGVTG